MSEKQKILIVDDEPRNRRILAEILEDLVDLKAAATGDEALAMLTDFRPDLVILDIMMPGIDGYEVCRRIRSNPELRQTKIILVSGKSMIEERIKGYEVGADEYMVKPFVPEELYAKAKVFLRLAMTEKELSTLNHSLDEKVHEKTRLLLEAKGQLINVAKMSALGEMAGGIAHEINTPLTIIGLNAQQVKDLIAEDPIDRSAITSKIQMVTKTISRINTIIQGLKTFSRDDSRGMFASVSVNEVIEDTLTLCTEKIKNGNIQLQLDPIPSDLTVHCRKVQISQVLLNLISNACDAILLLPDRWIRIAADRNGDLIRITVTDSGARISDEIQKKIFHPFFTTKEVGKGTGLGLSVSKGIIDAHHGNLTLDPACENTRFVVQLPEKSDPTGPDPKKPAA